MFVNLQGLYTVNEHKKDVHIKKLNRKYLRTKYVSLSLTKWSISQMHKMDIIIHVGQT